MGVAGTDPRKGDPAQSFDIDCPSGKSVLSGGYSIPPTYPAYQMAMSLLGLKLAYEKARKGHAKPAADEVAAAFKGIEFEGPSGRVKLAIGGGHQGISETAYGTYRFNKEKNAPEIVDVMRFPAECVNPPEGVNADEWIKEGIKGAKC